MKGTLKYNLSFLAAITLIPSTLLHGQSLQPASPEVLLGEFCKTSPWEELYIVTDRHDYIAGEDIWLKIFTIDRGTGLVLDRSKIAYVELLNPWNRPVIQLRFGLNHGTGEGNIFLPDTLSPGNYTLRAYTSWMKNFLPENCFMQQINIYNPFKNTGFRKKIFTTNNTNEPLRMDFFSEGGNFVNNVPNHVVVRLTGHYGQGIQTMVIVTDNEGNEMAEFNTGDYGYGSFVFTPVKGKSYYALTGNQKFNIPPAADEGITLIAEKQTETDIELSVNASERLVSSSEHYLILVHSRGKVSFKMEIPANESVAKIVIPRIRLAPGINHITLFGKDRMPLAERLVYNPFNFESTCEIETGNEYGRREKVAIGLTCQSKEDKLAEISLSVIPSWQAAQVKKFEDFMVFGSEFGIVPWFENDATISTISNEILDNFLVSTFSRWIRWEEITSEKLPARQYRFENEGHYIYGLLRNRDTGQPDTSAILYLSVPGKTAFFRYAVTGRDGRFNFYLPIDNRVTKMVIQPADTTKNSVLEIESPFPWKVPDAVCFTDTLSETRMKLASMLSFNYQTSRIYVTKYRKDAREDRGLTTRERKFYGVPDLVVRLDDYIKLPVMYEVFFELVPGVRFRERKSGAEMRVLEPLSNIFYNEPPLAMIDGVIIQNLSLIANLDPEIVEKIELVRSRYMIGDLYFSGIVNVITRKGDLSNIVLPDYAVNIRYRVTENPASFSPPDYSTEEKKESRIPDLRNTLYWNPSAIPGEQGVVTAEFWTHDQAGEYSIVATGVTQSGKLISTIHSFRIR
ncbi:MAG TPA: hypothetical protein PL101_11360 [Bacteroidales bacterium]|nr:hypothetical protein [Bacteroidales bacterium]